MTPIEFKAWFDGFTEAFSGCPTKAQWGRIKERVSEIDGKSVTHTVYVDRYVDRYPYLRPYWGYATCGSAIGNRTAGLAYAQAKNEMAQNCSNQIGSGGLAFNSSQAMADLGRAEARSIS